MVESGELRESLRLLKAELAAAHASMRTLVDSLPFDFWMMGADRRYLLQNEVARRRWGDAVGRRLEDFSVDEEMRALWLGNNRRAFAGETVREEVSYPLDGEMRHFFNIIAPIFEGESVRGILGINIDITDRKRLDEESQRVQRVESLGVLAAGLAHDFNNQLAAILASIDLARSSVSPDTGAHQRLVEAERACSDARGLTQQFLTFARGGNAPRAVIDLGPLVRDTATLAARGSSSLCELDVEDALWANVDASQVRQAVHNLVLNAVQAMTRAGVVRVTGRVVEPRASQGPAGRWVRIEVADEGIGISEQNLARVFDPYFTTKKEGRGLGLAVVHSVINKHGGVASVRSAVGKGTTFEILLPASVAPPSEPPVLREHHPAAPARLLLLDDEPNLRRLMATMLAEEGYEVEAVATAAEASIALRRARESERPLGAVLLDMTLRGGPSGLECLAELKSIDPTIAAIAMSGYTDAPAVAEPEGHGFGASLGKPFTRAELLDAVRRALRARS